MNFVLVVDQQNSGSKALVSPAPRRAENHSVALKHDQSPLAPRREPANGAPTAVATPPIRLAQNRRWSQRAALNTAGIIGAGAMAQPVACIVRDLSKFGALLEPAVGMAADLPECFVLVVTNNRIRTEANCIVRWRNQDRIGVCFAGPVRTMVERR